MADVERLRAVAEDVFAFHSSPWRIEPGHAGRSEIRSAGDVDGGDFHDGGMVGHDTFVLQLDTSSTAEFIAAFDPPTVLALLDRLAAAEAKVARVEALLAEGPDAWIPYESRDTGLTFLQESVLDFTADLRAALTEEA